MKKIFLLTILASVLSTIVLAQTPQTINLKDGTTIKGELISVANGVYTIQSPTMGQVKVAADQISSINAGNAMPSIPLNSEGQISKDVVQSLQASMMQDPQIVSLIQELVSDPEIAELSKNPSLLADALSMNPERVQNNPDVQKLLQHPTMQKILQLMTQKLHPTQN